MNVAIIQHLEALMKKHGGPVFQPPSAVGGKCTRQSVNKSFQVQVLANLAALEDGSGETSLGVASTSSSGQEMDPAVSDSSEDVSQMEVYKAPLVLDSMSPTAHMGFTHWLWGPSGHNVAHGLSASQPQVAQAAPSVGQMGGWPWDMGLVPPQSSWATCVWPSGQQSIGGVAWVGFCGP